MYKLNINKYFLNLNFKIINRNLQNDIFFVILQQIFISK